MEAVKETKFATKIACGMRMMPNVKYTHTAQRKRVVTTLDDENASQHVTSL